MMKEVTLGAVESRFADIVWSHAPLASGELVRICERELQWNKSTTYTVLRKLCNKGLFRNDRRTVSVVMTRAEFYAAQSEQFVTAKWGGSLPAFVAAFLSRKTLSDADADEIRRMIDASRQQETVTDENHANMDASRQQETVSDANHANMDASRQQETVSDENHANMDAGRKEG